MSGRCCKNIPIFIKACTRLNLFHNSKTCISNSLSPSLASCSCAPSLKELSSYTASRSVPNGESDNSFMPSYELMNESQELQGGSAA